MVDDPVGSGMLVPRPDPTVLTTQALEREISQVNVALKSEIQGLRDLLTGRMDHADAATSLRLESLLDIPTKINEEVSHLELLVEERLSTINSVHEEKFRGISLQFAERDIRTDQAARSSKEALDAALLAAKELVGATNLANAAAAAKAEDNFTKQIDQIALLITTQAQATDARITEIKERIDRGGGEQSGAAFQQNESRLNMGVVMGIISIILVLIFGIASAAIALGAK